MIRVNSSLVNNDLLLPIFGSRSTSVSPLVLLLSEGVFTLFRFGVSSDSRCLEATTDVGHL